MSKKKSTSGGRAAKKEEVSLIRSSAAEYLTFVAASGHSEVGVEMRYEDEKIWLTQKMMAALYDVSVPAINQHLKRIFSDNELESEATVKKYLIVQTEGSRQVQRSVEHYSHERENMGLTYWEGAPMGKIHRYDVSLAKNYLSEFELGQMQRIVSAYLDMAEMQAMRKIPMTMQDWEKRLCGFLQLWDRDILKDAGKVSAELAKAHAESEFEKYRIVQDRLFESDFDRLLRELPAEGDKP